MEQGNQFPLKMSNFSIFFPSDLKKFLRVRSESTPVKAGSASYLLRVKSKLGSGPISRIQRFVSGEILIRGLGLLLMSKYRDKTTLAYGAQAWSSQISYHLRSKLRSSFFFLMRAVLRDFDRRLNRAGMLEWTGLESIEAISFKRISVFIFNLVRNLAPTSLCHKLLSKMLL